MLHDWLGYMGGIPKNMKVIFCNTGREDERTFKFLHNIETHWGVPVIWLEYTRVPASTIDCDIFPTKRRGDHVRKQAEAGENTHWFRQVSYETAHRKEQPNRPFDVLLEWMSVLPNNRVRACSSQLKARTAMRYLWSMGIYEFTSYIGFRDDEHDRANKTLAAQDTVPGNTFGFPLIEFEVDESGVMEFWAKQSFDLQMEQFEGNCDLCFMKKEYKRLEFIRRNPDAADWWIGWEVKKALVTDADGGKFIKNKSYKAMKKVALQLANPLFDDDPQGKGFCEACTDGTLSYPDDGD